MPKLPTPTAQDMPAEALGQRLRALEKLLGMFVPVPESWLKQAPRGSGMACASCSSYGELVNSWRKALKWTDGLDHALAVMLAAVSSTKTLGDQLWIKVISPPSGGKSTLCEALSVCSKYVVAKSTIRGFHSGYKTDSGGAEDNSLIPLIRDKTLVTKDGDTLLQSPNLSQILSEARDLYDSTSRTHYRNKTSRDYTGVRMTWILCGTSSLRAIDSSELGERFLDCVIMEEIDDDLEDDILWRIVNRADKSVSVEADGKPETQYEAELAEAMALTGGYVAWLRENAVEKLAEITTGEKEKRLCTRLGKFVAHMRARPSTKQNESVQRELGARLVSQLARLAKCLALVLNRESVDGAVMQRVKRVAFDTARGRTLAITAKLYEVGGKGLEAGSIALAIGETDDKTRGLLRFLRKIKVVESYQVDADLAKWYNVPANRIRWCLTERMEKLYQEVRDD